MFETYLRVLQQIHYRPTFKFCLNLFPIAQQTTQVLKNIGVPYLFTQTTQLFRISTLRVYSFSGLTLFSFYTCVFTILVFLG